MTTVSSSLTVIEVVDNNTLFNSEPPYKRQTNKNNTPPLNHEGITLTLPCCCIFSRILCLVTKYSCMAFIVCCSLRSVRESVNFDSWLRTILLISKSCVFFSLFAKKLSYEGMKKPTFKKCWFTYEQDSILVLLIGVVAPFVCLLYTS